jgi:DNA-binding transcriptional MerR regulator
MSIRALSGHAGLIKASDAARLLGVTPRTLARWSGSGVLGEPIRVGPGQRRFYYRRDIDAVLRDGATTDE